MMTTEPKYSLLLVEDDPAIGTGVRSYLSKKGYHVTLVVNGEQALESAQNSTYDLILLDIMIPKVNGLEVLRILKEKHIRTPVLVLSALAEQKDILAGFGLGVDDYLTKPFSFVELEARAKAILNRTLPPDRSPMDVCYIGDLTINFTTHEASRGVTAVTFTALEYDILRYLIQNRNKTISRKQLLRNVWKIDENITTRTVDRHIASVRKKIEPNPEIPKFIETIYGLGYRLNL